jgi:hypothetical protein
MLAVIPLFPNYQTHGGIMITTRTAAISIVLGLATLAAPSAYAQQVIGPTKASELVALTNANGSIPCPGQSNWEAVNFLPLRGTTLAIPVTEVLVVTEIAIDRLNPLGKNTNDLSAWLVSGGGTAPNPFARQSATLDSNGIGGATLTIPQGIRVPSGATLCVEKITTGGFREAFAYGYLAPNQ